MKKVFAILIIVLLVGIGLIPLVRIFWMPADEQALFIKILGYGLFLPVAMFFLVGWAVNTLKK